MSAQPHLLSYIAGGIAAGMVATHVLEPPVLSVWASTPPIASNVGADLHPPAIAVGVNRTAKADRLPGQMDHAGAGVSVRSVELIGVTDTSIIYRDRTGRVLFQSDPLTNTTMISKNTVLPMVTVKQAEQAPVKHQIFEIQEQGAQPSNTSKCEPVSSPIVDPKLRGLVGRCFA